MKNKRRVSQVSRYHWLKVLVFFGLVAVPSGIFASEVERAGPFIAYDDGTVKDTERGIVWAARDNGRDVTWEEAKAYCESYGGGGYTDWRMPTSRELASLYDKKKGNRAGYHATPLIHISNFWVWASETNGSKGANFDFTYGRLYWSPKNGRYNSRALPVRDAE